MEKCRYYYGCALPEGAEREEQENAFRALGAETDEIVMEEIAALDAERKVYHELCENRLHRGDTLVIRSLDRLNYNKVELRRELQQLREKGVRLKVLNLPSTMREVPEKQQWAADWAMDILIEALEAVARQEREIARVRQAEGIAAARARGVRMGRPAIKYPENWQEVYNAWKAKEIQAKTAAEMINVQRTTFYNLVYDTEGRKKGKVVCRDHE